MKILQNLEKPFKNLWAFLLVLASSKKINVLYCNSLNETSCFLFMIHFNNYFHLLTIHLPLISLNDCHVPCTVLCAGNFLKDVQMQSLPSGCL